DAAMNNRDALAIDARGRQRIGNATGDRDHAIDGAIVQVGRENAVGPVVHPPRNDQRTREAARKRRHRMRARGVEMNDVIAFTFENRAQPDGGCEVDSVADAQRMASDARGGGLLPEPSRGIANQLRAIYDTLQLHPTSNPLAAPALSIAGAASGLLVGCSWRVS